ncbi:MAG: penicillin acylase family protein [Gemmatimonadaceae bacterium]
MRLLRALVLVWCAHVFLAEGNAQPLMDSARTRLAQLDGTILVPGLDSAVEVRRDRWGIPHIYARTQHDVFLAQGFVAAQDRLWQMEMWRRAGEGRVSEIVGPSAIGRDRFARLLRYRGDMNAEWASYAPDARQIIRAFVEGVNAYIAIVKDRPPIEFTITGIAPEPWSEDVPLQRMAALAMTGNAATETSMAQFVSALGVKMAEVLLPTDPYRPLDPAPGLDLSGIDHSSLGDAAEAASGVRFQRVEGSNNWVVRGEKTTTGKPLLANDPHRAISLPSLRYLTHLVGPGWNVIGAGEPALPGVAGGHNEKIGFGFTIVGMDQQDVYVETVRDCDDRKGEGTEARGPRRGPRARCYLKDGNWKPVRIIVDTIRVKGEDPRVLRLEFTEHGPILSEDTVRGRAFALRFVGSEPGTAGYLAQISLNRATDWPSFLDAAKRWKLPTENLIYADVDGNIGWVAAGLMPVRHWSGLLPVPGTGKYEWNGFLDFKDLPRSFNPTSGFIVTANNNILPPAYGHQLNYEWAAPYRAQRISSVLSSGSRFTRADFERLQHDEFSIPARELIPVLLAAAAARGAESRREIRMLGSWNFVMDRDSAAPLIYQAWLRACASRVFRPRAGLLEQLIDSEWDLPTLLRLLKKPDAAFGKRAAAARDSLILLALDDAVRELTALLGEDRTTWSWGALHRANFRHPLAAAFDLPSVPRGGDGNTVNATGSGGRGNYLQQGGASYRVIVDLADWDNSVATNTPGQSGQPGSEFYDNLLGPWSAGEYIPLVFSRERVEKETKHLLSLVPAR